MEARENFSAPAREPRLLAVPLVVAAVEATSAVEAAGAVAMTTASPPVASSTSRVAEVVAAAAPRSWRSRRRTRTKRQAADHLGTVWLLLNGRHVRRGGLFEALEEVSSRQSRVAHSKSV